MPFISEFNARKLSSVPTEQQFNTNMSIIKECNKTINEE